MPFSITPTRAWSENSCRALRAISNGVAFERTTISTPSHAFASTLASETGMAGGESMMIQSNRGSTRCSSSFSRPLPTSSAGSAAPVPLGMKNRFSKGPRCMIGKLVILSQQVIGQPRI